MAEESMNITDIIDDVSIEEMKELGRLIAMHDSGIDDIIETLKDFGIEWIQ